MFFKAADVNSPKFGASDDFSLFLSLPETGSKSLSNSIDEADNKEQLVILFRFCVGSRSGAIGGTFFTRIVGALSGAIEGTLFMRIEGALSGAIEDTLFTRVFGTRGTPLGLSVD